MNVESSQKKVRIICLMLHSKDNEVSMFGGSKFIRYTVLLAKYAAPESAHTS